MNKADISAMSPITRRLDAILKAAGFTLLEAERAISGHDQAVNNLAYINGAGERVFINTHELPQITEAPEIEEQTADNEPETLQLFNMKRIGLHDLFRDFDEAMEYRQPPEVNTVMEETI